MYSKTVILFCTHIILTVVMLQKSRFTSLVEMNRDTSNETKIQSFLKQEPVSKPSQRGDGFGLQVPNLESGVGLSWNPTWNLERTKLESNLEWGIGVGRVGNDVESSL